MTLFVVFSFSLINESGGDFLEAPNRDRLSSLMQIHDWYVRFYLQYHGSGVILMKRHSTCSISSHWFKLPVMMTWMNIPGE
jgi:hypothetical protein